MTKEDIIWMATLDDAYEVAVERIDEFTGLLTIAPIGSDDFIDSKTVDLAYGARFGPDVDDIAYWQDWALRIVG